MMSILTVLIYKNNLRLCNSLMYAWAIEFKELYVNVAVNVEFIFLQDHCSLNSKDSRLLEQYNHSIGCWLQF